MQHPPIQVTFLGTGTSQGIPVIGCGCETCTSADPRDKRLRCSVFIETQGVNLVVDAGPDFRQQMLRENIDRVDAILLTHEHNDHIIGLDDVRPFNFKYWKDMPIYGTERVLEQVKQRFGYIFSENPYPGAPMLRLFEISKEKKFGVEGVEITPVEVQHGGIPVMGFRIGGFTYLTDVKSIPENEKEKIKGTHTLVLSALHHQEHHSHLTLAQALDLIEELAPQRAYLIHLSHSMGRTEEVSKLLPPNVAVAYDGLRIGIT